MRPTARRASRIIGSPAGLIEGSLSQKDRPEAELTRIWLDHVRRLEIWNLAWDRWDRRKLGVFFGLVFAIDLALLGLLIFG